MKGWKESARVGVNKKNTQIESNPPMGEAPRNNPARAWRTRDWSRFFLSKTKERFKKTFRYPLAGSLFSNGILVPESRRASVFLPLPPASLRALALCSLSPALPGSPLSLPSPSLPLLPPPAPFPLRGSLASALGSRARAPLLHRGLGAGAPRRLAARGAGAAEQRHSAAVAAAARRCRRGTLAERARPPAVPWTDLLPGPKTDGLPELPRKTPKSSALLPPHPHLQPRAGCALPPPPLPRPLGHRVVDAGGGSAEAQGRGVQDPQSSRGLEEGQ